MSHVLGIDAGNSKTIALIATLDGRIIGHGRSTCGDMYGCGETAAFAAQIDAARQAGLGTRVTASTLRAMVLCAAGADWPEDHDAIRDAFACHGFGAPGVFNDAFGGLRAGTPDGVGVVVQCGTGAAIGACGTDGRRWHSGFWIDDYGGGALGRSAIRAAKLAELGHAPATTLTARLLAHYRVQTVEALLHTVHARASIAAKPRTLAPLVLNAAADGDTVARELVLAQAAALGDYAVSAARMVGLGAAPFALVLSGGVFRHASMLLRDAIVARTQAVLPTAQLVAAEFEPAVGALMLALEAAGTTIDDAVRAQLRATRPGMAVFATAPASG